ncbi:unnamed protein product [Meganyctiphanes norvegica]|uniref:SH3 domain-containing protein n=1 Tax=Meganyctiphanes norvegica TaxID=48144 RepID=A0AAV2PTT6_MEGNR
MLACVCHPARAHNLPNSLESDPQRLLPTVAHHYDDTVQVITKENRNVPPLLENESWDASQQFTDNGYVTWRKQKGLSSSSEPISDFKKSDQVNNNNNLRTLDRNGNIQEEKMRPLEKIPKGELDLGSPCKVPKVHNSKLINSETINRSTVISNAIKPNNITKNKDNTQTFSNKSSLSSSQSSSTKAKLSSSLSNPISSSKDKSSTKSKSSTLPSRNKSSSIVNENVSRSVSRKSSTISKSSSHNIISGGRGGGGSCGSSSCSSSKSSSQGSPSAGGGRGGSCNSSTSSGRGSSVRERSSASGSSSSSSPSNSLRAGGSSRALPLRPPEVPVRTTSTRDARAAQQELQPLEAASVSPPVLENDTSELLDGISFPVPQLPDGCELTVGELHDMASRQQQQIETQQQLLVAREQRLKYLKQQDTRAHQVHQEAERLRRLRERVEAQEAKLRRLRALRGQVEATRMNTASLTTDLDAMRHLFSEKEKELVVAVGKVEELTHQLEELREGRSALNPNNQHHNELDKLRRELLYRNSVNREASARVAQQRETLAARRDEITKIDKRIAELQQRLHRKRLLNQQLASQITAATQAKQAQLKAVQQKSLRDGSNKENSIDDSHVEHLKIPSGEELGEFGPNKHDPKYQTLPYNTKFSMGNMSKEQSWESEGSMPTSEYQLGSESRNSGSAKSSLEELANSNNANSVNSSVVRTVHSIPTSVPSRGLAHAPQLQQVNAPAAQSVNPAMNPRVYGPNSSQINQRSQPLGSSGHGTNQDSSSVLPPTSLSLSFIQKLNPGVTSQAQSRILLASAHLAQGVENIRAMDGSSGELVAADDSGGDGRNKPALPPKPAVPSKPLPPPRQKGDSMCSSTESLNSLHQTPPHNKNHPGYRYASQNVIMSTYTQQPSGADNYEATEDNNWPNNVNNNNNIIHKRDSEGEKVHVSINRRIEMPPDFMFPEDETPPSDLLGQRVEEIENGYVETRTENGLDLVDNLHAPSVPYNELEKLRIDVSKEDNSNQDKGNSNMVYSNTPVSNISHTTLEESRQPDGADTPTALQEGHTDVEAENINYNVNSNISTSNNNTQVVRRIKKGNLKTKNSNRVLRRVSFDPLALLLDASLEGELELVRRTAMEVPNPSAANDEGITALHNAICAGHLDIVTFLVTFGCDVNAQDSDGWTPLHCAASCNNVAMVRFLVEHGACILATTLSDHETAAEKCEQDEEGYDGCSQYLYSVQEKLGIMNGGVVYSVYDYEAQAVDELDMGYNDSITILRRGDEYEREWWWGQRIDKQGYIPRNLLGLYPRVKNPLQDS